MDALLLLSFRARKEEKEHIIDSTSCFSTSLLRDMVELGYIDYSNRQDSYVITEKGKLTLRYLQKPWNDKNMRKRSQVSHQNDQILHAV